MVRAWSFGILIGLSAVAALMSRHYRYWAGLGGFWRVSGVLAIAACIAENSAIACYKYYSYSPEWGVFIGHVPLHVVLIWPLFILGEYHYLRDALRIGKLATLRFEAVSLRAAFCLVDVTLLAHIVEVYCVSAGLWSWRHSNCLGVPWIGALGWAFFATPAVVLLSGMEEARSTSQLRLMLLPLISVGVLHLALVTTWHVLGFRRLEDFQVSGSVVASAILIIQCIYHLAIAALKLKPVLLLSEELPRLLACGIVASLWVFKGSLCLDSCLVTAASLVRLLSFQLC